MRSCEGRVRSNFVVNLVVNLVDPAFDKVGDKVNDKVLRGGPPDTRWEIRIDPLFHFGLDCLESPRYSSSRFFATLKGNQLPDGNQLPCGNWSVSVPPSLPSTQFHPATSWMGQLLPPGWVNF